MDSKVLGSFGDFDLFELLHRQRKNIIGSHRVYILDPVHQRNALGIGTIFADFLKSAMQVSNNRFGFDNNFAVHRQYKAADTMRRGMVRSHIDLKFLCAKSLCHYSTSGNLLKSGASQFFSIGFP